MPEFVFSSAFSVFLLLTGAVAAFTLARFTYRNTIPPVPPRIRILLFLLRGAGLFFLFFFIGEPLLSIIQSSDQPPITVVLTDDSRSMTIRDPGGTRSEQLLGILRSEAIHKLDEIGAVRFLSFGSQPRELESRTADSLRFRSDHTDITGSLRFVQEQSLTENIRSVVLLSDGNSTVGPSPIFDQRALTLPVFAIGIGDTSEQKDLLIRKVTTNNIVYAGTRVPVNVQVKSSGAQNERVEISLRHESGLLDRQYLSLEPGTREYPVTLSYVPSVAGIQRYAVEVSGIPGELTGRNNRAGFFAKVLESKLNVLLFAGGPSPDVAFLRRSLEADSNITVTAYVERGSGSYYGTAPGTESLSNQQCIILAGFPTSATPAPVVNLVVQAAERGVGILFIPSRTIDVERLATLTPILPLHLNNGTGNEQRAFLHVPDRRENDILLNLPPDLPYDVWSNLPPLYTIMADVRAKPEATVHGVARIRTVVTDHPMLLSRNVNRRKSVALLGYGLWRWTMLTDPGATGVLDALIGNWVRWLTTRDEESRLRVETSKESYTSGEPVEFSAQVYDESLQPVEGAQISVILNKGDDQADLIMRSLGNGQYEGQIHGLKEANYTYEATVRRNSSLLGRVTGSFFVGESNAEFLETRSNHLLLRQLAARTGGRFYLPETPPTLAEDIAALPGFQSREMRRSRELALWNLPWSLLAVVVLFSLEWFIRKTKGML